MNRAHVEAQLELPTILYLVKDSHRFIVALLTNSNVLESKGRIFGHFDVIWGANVVEALRSLIGTRIDDQGKRRLVVVVVARIDSIIEDCGVDQYSYNAEQKNKSHTSKAVGVVVGLRCVPSDQIRNHLFGQGIRAQGGLESSMWL